jgi:hypothetical protein
VSRTREADHIDEWLLDERCTRRRTAWQNMEQPIGQAGFLKQPSEDHTTGYRRLHVGFQDHGVAHCESGGDRPRTQDEGRVPRRDNANDTDRNPPSDTLTPGFQVGGQDPLRLAAECCRFQELA